LNRALELLAEPKKGRAAAKSKSKEALRELGTHPEDDSPVNIYDGPYGPYIKHGKTNASLPEGESVENITLSTAIELLSAKASTKSPRKTTKSTTKSTTTKSTTTRGKKKDAAS
jgi:DNA topoisomerase-1